MATNKYLILPSPPLHLSSKSETCIAPTPMGGSDDHADLCFTVISNVADSSEEELGISCQKIADGFLLGLQCKWLVPGWGYVVLDDSGSLNDIT